MAPISSHLSTLAASTPTLAKRYYYYTTYYFPVGAIVGIVIVCIIIFLLIISICVRRSRRSRGAVPYQPQPYRAGGAPGAVGYNQSYANNGYGAQTYPSQYAGAGVGAGAAAVPSQYGNNQQTELGTEPKMGHDASNPIQGVPPVYSGPGTFYGNNRNVGDQTGIVR